MRVSGDGSETLSRFNDDEVVPLLILHRQLCQNGRRDDRMGHAISPGARISAR